LDILALGLVHTLRVNQRFLIPFVLVGALLALAIGTALVGVSEKQSSPAARGRSSSESAAAELHRLVTRTLKVSSFSETIRISGSDGSGSESLIYNAPGRFETLSPTTHQPISFQDGAIQYLLNLSGPGWATITIPKRAEVRTADFGFLSQFLRVAKVQRSGNAFITSYTTRTAGSHPVPVAIMASVRSTGGYVSEIELTERTSDPVWNGHKFDAHFDRFNSSPTITIPVAHAATVPSVPCGPFEPSTCGEVAP
jgi:hypothetical protein